MVTLERFEKGYLELFHAPRLIENYTAKVITNACFLILDEIPCEEYRVNIDGYNEVLNLGDIQEENDYFVDYTSCVVYFHKSKMGQSITITDYWGMGLNFLGATRIITRISADGRIIETLDDVINAYPDLLNKLQEAREIVVIIQGLLDKIVPTQNPDFTVGKTNWVEFTQNGEKFYKYTLTHNLHSRNLIVSMMNLDTSMNMPSPAFSYDDENKITVYSVERVNAKYVICSKYYYGAENLNSEIIQEVRDSRFGKGSLNQKIAEMCASIKALDGLMLRPELFGLDKNNLDVSLQKCLDYCRDNGGGAVYVDKGVYLVEKQLRIYGDTILKLHPNAIIMATNGATMLVNGDKGVNYNGYNGYGNILIEGGTWISNSQNYDDSTRNIFGLARGKNITIRDVTFKNVKYSHAIDLNACKDVLIEHCKFLGYKDINDNSRTYAEAIQICEHTEAGYGYCGSFDGTPCQNVTVKDCYFGASDYYGAWGTGVGNHASVHNKFNTNIKVINNTFEGMLHAGVRPFKWKDVLIDGNTFINTKMGVCISSVLAGSVSSKDASGNQINKSQAGRNTKIVNNAFINCGTYGIYGSGQFSSTSDYAPLQDVIIDNNTFIGEEDSKFTTASIGLYYGEQISITNNNFKHVGRGVWGKCINGLRVITNDFVDMVTEAIYTSEDENSLINLGYTQNHTISNNIIDSCGRCGINLNHVWEFTVSENQLRNISTESVNGRSAIIIGSNCQDGDISKNIVSSRDIHNKYGIEVTGTCNRITVENDNIWNGITANFKIETVTRRKPQTITVTSVQELDDAITSAIYGDVIKIKAGTYVIDRSFEIPKGVTISGSGISSCIFDCRNTSINNVFRNKLNGTETGYNTFDITIEGINFNGYGTTNTITVIAMAHAQNVIVQDCMFQRFNTWHNIELNGCQLCYIQRNRFSNYGYTSGGNPTEVIQLDFCRDNVNYPWTCNYDATHCKNIYIEENNFYKIKTTATGAIGTHNHDTNGKYHKNIFVRHNTLDTVECFFHLFGSKKVTLSHNVGETIGCFVKLGSNGYSNQEQFNICNNVLSGDINTRYFFTGREPEGRFVWGVSDHNDTDVQGINICNNVLRDFTRHTIGITGNHIIIIGNDIRYGGYNGIYIYGGYKISCNNNIIQDVARLDGNCRDIKYGGNGNVTLTNCAIVGNVANLLNGGNVGGNFMETCNVTG